MLNTEDSLLSRRELLNRAAMMAAAGAVSRVAFAGSRAAPEESFYESSVVAEGKARLTVLIGDGGNSLVGACEGGAWSLLIDAKNPALGAMLRGKGAKDAGASFDAGECWLINTHHHADHTGGNWAFSIKSEKPAEIIAHGNARPRVLTQTRNYVSAAARAVKSLEGDSSAKSKLALPFAQEYLAKCESFAPDAWVPTKLVGGESSALTLGKDSGAPLAIEAHHFGPGHTDNDLVLRLPEQNVIHMGDLLFHKRWPFIDRASGASTENWMKCLERAAALCDERTVVVPGHGPVTNRDGIRAQLEFFVKVREAVTAAITAGKTREDVEKLEPAGLGELGGEQVRPRALGAIFDELMTK